MVRTSCIYPWFILITAFILMSGRAYSRDGESKAYENVFAITVGISKYPNRALPGAAKGAEAMEHLFETMNIAQGKKKVVSFLDEEARFSAISSTFSQWAGVNRAETEAIPTKEDLVVFYFSGHGTPSSKGVGDNSAPSDAYLVLNESALYSAVLMNELTQITAKHYLIILDCCYANEFGDYFEANWPKSLEGKWTLLSAVSGMMDAEMRQQSLALVFDGQDYNYYTLALLYGLLGEAPVRENYAYHEPKALNHYAKKRVEEWLELAPPTKMMPHFTPKVYGNKEECVIIGKSVIPSGSSDILPGEPQEKAFLELRIYDKGDEPTDYVMYKMLSESDAKSRRDNTLGEILAANGLTIPRSRIVWKDRFRGGIVVKQLPIHPIIRQALKFNLDAEEKYLLQLRGYPYEDDEFIYSPKKGDSLRVAHTRVESESIKRLKSLEEYAENEAKLKSLYPRLPGSILVDHAREAGETVN